jgi:hypothetical protein
MIDVALLVSTLKRDVTALVADLRGRVDADESVREPLESEYRAAFDAGRTGRTFTEWSQDRLTQVAVAWVLACVFVRFSEDNGLIADARLAGPGVRGDHARAAQQDYFISHPNSSDRDYLHDVFGRAAALPGLGELLGPDASPLWLLDPTADSCTALIRRFRSVGDDGTLTFDFTDPSRSTRFLGDLYQDLSDSARADFALLQTPDFVESFILDRTLTPAIDAFGLAATTLIDPTCGSGHFLLGAFDRLCEAWRAAEPATDERIIAARALAAVAGVDLNPFAVAIARFRLLVAALRFCRITSLADAPNFHVNVAVGDSLLWGTGKAIEHALPGVDDASEAERLLLYKTEHADDLQRVLGHTYTAVVGNPPYIVARDKALNEAYRRRYTSCSGKYSLAVPFMERFFGLAARPDGFGRPAGFVGQITTNAWMKREFGRKLIEKYLPTVDLTHVIDTSLPEIPGHNQTVILFGRNQGPKQSTIRTVMGIRGEPSTPADPAKGLVWSAIVAQVDVPGSQSDYVSVADTDVVRFRTHPWSIGGGGASELKEMVDRSIDVRLGSLADSIGFASFPAADDVFFSSLADFMRHDVPEVRAVVTGEMVRDFSVRPGLWSFVPYDQNGVPIELDRSAAWYRRIWPNRAILENTMSFGGRTRAENGDKWWTWYRWIADKYVTPLSIAFAEIATHNHFVLDRGGKVFKQTAPVIKLPADATVDDYLRLIGLLNSSTACFWLKEVMYKKSSAHGGGSTDQPFTHQFAFDGTKLKQFPIPAGGPPLELARLIDALALDRQSCLPAAVGEFGVPTRPALDAAQACAEQCRAEMIALQEELDWWCLHQYGITGDKLCAPEGAAPPLALGERAFEIVLARQVDAGEVETAWFTRHGSTPITEIPAHWPGWYRDLVAARIERIETDPDVALIERPECKRRWAAESWSSLETDALANWLLTRLEDRALWFDGPNATCRSLRQLADRVATDTDWMDVARLWAGTADIDPVAAVTALVADQHVPAQAAARYTASGLAKRAEWERVWDLQRAEDRGEVVGKIPVPPKYGQADFAKGTFWTQRGKLDVPKERFVSLPGAERDGTLVLAWAGFDHVQLAQALGTVLHQRQSADGWTGEQLVPLIAALDEVVPWVEQWYPDVDPAVGQPLGRFYAGMVDTALAGIGATRAVLADWRPPTPTRGRKAKTTT